MDEVSRALEPLIPGLRRYARAMVANRAEADDLVQDCLERAIGRWGQRRGRDVRPWLFAILHNLAVSRWRRLARRGASFSLDEVEPSALAAPPGRLEADETRDVLKALATLSDEHRAVLLLVAVEDLSYAQTAEALGVPLGTVMSRLSRARAALSGALDPGAARTPHLRRVK